ncbi:unnamed protein product [Adineta ricciae]|uniref:Calcium-transporting ATPase n=1 Tax=Adineta ricciae TaxID=249248 RepID=A0A816AP33_ADIRI|nr:unnamed protein product [Adineta ricciae]
MPNENLEHTDTVNVFKISREDLEHLMQTYHHDGLRELNSEAFGGLTGLEKKLQTNFISGLSGNPIDLSNRQKLFGWNEIPQKTSKSFLRLMFEALQDVTLIILMICSLISFGLAFYRPDHQSFEFQLKKHKETNVEWIEGAAIIFAVIVVIIVTAFNDWSKERQFRGLQKRIEQDQTFNLIRNNQLEQVHLKDIVVGDVCHIKYGDLLPADGLVIQSNDLKVDESSLTGESDLISKNLHKNPFLLSGTHVMEGSGKMLVIAVGEHSQTGAISSLLRSPAEIKNQLTKTQMSDDNHVNRRKHKERSILQTKLTKLAIQIGYVGMIVASLTVLVLIVRFSWEEFIVKRQPWQSKYWNRFIRHLITGITVLVVAVPEGLPLAVTISLAYAVKKMMYDNNLVRHLDACETMGNATTICSDKTGTLTTNRMTVVEAYLADKHWKNVHNPAQIKEMVLPEKIKEVLFEGISVNSSYTSKLVAPIEKELLPKQVGNKTECGLLNFILDLNGNYEDIRKIHPEEDFLHVYTFNSIRKLMSTVIQRTDAIRLHMKGASEIVLQKCTTTLDQHGNLIPLTKDDYHHLLHNVIEPMASDGLRTICIAYKDFTHPPDDWNDETTVFEGLTCVCICGIEDPVRPEVRQAIEQCKNAGITVRMITGDNVNTARSIALKCGIITPTDPFLVLDGKEFNRRIRPNRFENVDQDLFDKVGPHLRVLARSSPQDKYLLVKHLVESKHSFTREIVAVTGDGTNDGPALKKADIGFSMGIQGTDVAKEASDIILIDDNFTSIVKAIMWGRNVTDSISKFLQFQLTVNIVALVCAFVGSCIVKESPLRAVQMLWVNLIMDTLASLALATDRPTEDLLKRKPTGRNYSLINHLIAKNIILQAIYQLTIILFLLFAGPRAFDIQNGQPGPDGYVPSEHFTMIFNAFVLMTLFNEINCRRIHGEINVFRHMFSNKIFCIIWLTTFILQILLIQYGSLVFSCVQLSIDQWMWCLLFGIGTLLWNQVINLLPSPTCSCFPQWNKQSTGNQLGGMVNDAYEHCHEPNLIRSPISCDLNSSDHDDIKNLRILWLRNITRIQIQLRVIRAFRKHLLIGMKHNANRHENPINFSII